MSRQQAFEAIYAKQYDVPAESLVQYRFESKEGYSLPGIASHYRFYCLAMDSEEIDNLRKDSERLDWLCGQSRPVVEGQTMSSPEGELAGYDWGVFGACGTVREAIDYSMTKGDQP